MVGRGTAIRRAAALLLGSGLALAGLITLIVLWVQVATGSMLTGAGQEQPCVTAAAEGADGARVDYAVLPPSAVCHWSPDGAVETVDLGSAPAALSWIAAGAVLVGAVLIAVVAVVTWRQRRAVARAAENTV